MDLSELAAVQVRLQRLHDQREQLISGLHADGASRRLAQLNGELGFVNTQISHYQNAYNRLVG